jgi:hypothetical protein
MFFSFNLHLRNIYMCMHVSCTRICNRTTHNPIPNDHIRLVDAYVSLFSVVMVTTIRTLVVFFVFFNHRRLSIVLVKCMQTFVLALNTWLRWRVGVSFRKKNEIENDKFIKKREKKKEIRIFWDVNVNNKIRFLLSSLRSLYHILNRTDQI